MNTDKLIERKLSSEKVFDGALLHIEHWQVELPDGRTALREIARHIGAVAVIPVDKDGNVTMVYQYRPALGRVTIEIPAGKLDSADEDPLEAAQRELREETGLTASKWTRLGAIVPSPGYLTERIHLFLAEDMTQGDTDPDDDEFLNVERIPLSDLIERVMRGEIEDAKTQSGILMAARVRGC